MKDEEEVIIIKYIIFIIINKCSRIFVYNYFKKLGLVSNIKCISCLRWIR